VREGRRGEGKRERRKRKKEKRKHESGSIRKALKHWLRKTKTHGSREHIAPVRWRLAEAMKASRWLL
jgi:hypothetical protein